MGQGKVAAENGAAVGNSCSRRVLPCYRKLRRIRAEGYEFRL